MQTPTLETQQDAFQYDVDSQKLPLLLKGKLRKIQLYAEVKTGGGG